MYKRIKVSYIFVSFQRNTSPYHSSTYTHKLMGVKHSLLHKKKTFFSAFLSISVCLLIFSNSQAQTSWRKSVKAAEAAVRQSEYEKAAQFYQSAWEAKPSKKKYIYQAGEYYTIVRNYIKAAEAYKQLRDDKDFPLAQLYYARMLKQSGACDKAAPEYADFTINYNGADADKMRDIIQNEIRGCDFALMSIKAAQKNPIQVTRLSSNVNSDQSDFAPVAFADDLMYFSSNISGKASIYRSQKQNGNWSKASVPNGFPEYKKTDFCNGAFSPDNKRFYFTECKAKDGLQAECELYVMVRKGSNWSEPLRLPETINAKGYTVTHPYVSQREDMEVLYFASNKPGGQGSMDIWQTTRNITSGDLDFTPSTNLGELINTAGDEITPFFDVSDNSLYFASNGHISIGGLDIMKSKLSNINNNWSKVENVGAPLSSSADDYYYVKNKSKTGGFFVSNRATKDRLSTNNEDIFEFVVPIKNLSIKGQILDKSNSVVLKDVRVNLYEVLNNGQKRLLNTKTSSDGNYEFSLLADKKFRVESEKKGFRTAVHEFVAKKDSINNGIEKNLYLEEEAKAKEVTLSEYIDDTNTKNKPNSSVASTTPIKTNASTRKDKTPEVVLASKNTASKPSTTNSKPSAPTTTPPPPTVKNNEDKSKGDVTMTEKGLTSVGVLPLYEIQSKDNERLITSAPKLDGTYYKIQMIAVKRFDMEENRYRSIKDLGRIDTEYIIKKDMVRVLLADFFDYEDAQKTLAEVKKNREFIGAFVVKYENGTRQGQGK